MNTKKEMIAMLLAGGQGSRLHVLTKEIAKPAVPFGGKYRIIDFPLSNCVNSGIDTVGVLTQYRPLALNSYIGNGQPWDLDRLNGGAFILPPYMGATSGTWYKGTANAIYQNINFIERYHPRYVLVLSGDHIYKMNYAKMLSYHKQKHAGATIAVLEVPIESAGRFGILKTDEDGYITDFIEKPVNPPSNKASMGIYIFDWSLLKRYLMEDEADPDSNNDFGKDIIPAMLSRGEKLAAYEFYGYWKDVGTVQSLWQANMDLLNPEKNLNLDSDKWRIFARNEPRPPHYMGENGEVSTSMVSEGCYIDGKVKDSVLFSGVTVEQGAQLQSAVVMKHTHIGKNVKICDAIIAEDVTVEEGAVIGAPAEGLTSREQWGIAVVGRGARVRQGQTILPRMMLEPHSGR